MRRGDMRVGIYRVIRVPRELPLDSVYVIKRNATLRTLTIRGMKRFLVERSGRGGGGACDGIITGEIRVTVNDR